MAEVEWKGFPPFLLGKRKLLKNAAAFTSALLAKLLRRRTYSTEKAFMRRGMLYWIGSKSSGETEINDVPFSPFALPGNARPTVFSSFSFFAPSPLLPRLAPFIFARPDDPCFVRTFVYVMCTCEGTSAEEGKCVTVYTAYV